jgi:adenine-specific DNA-methyltransferase
MNFKALESEQKLRGGYYTPDPIARFLIRWALRGNAARVLEPSCGDGRFLEAIHAEMQAQKLVTPSSIDAVEVMKVEAEKAMDAAKPLELAGVPTKVANSDFFSWIANGKASSQWDAIIGNPPYIRYQYFDEKQRDIAQLIFNAAQVPFTKRTNAWVPFLIASIMHLTPGGRLAMVVPAELLHIQHADGLRHLLEQEMESVVIISIRDIVFDGTLQGVVLLLGRKRQGRNFLPLDTDQENLFVSSTVRGEEKTYLQIIDVHSISDLEELDLEPKLRRVKEVRYHGDWMRALLSPKERELIDRIVRIDAVKPFEEVADVDIGIVTGANNFFVVDEETLHKYRLEEIASPMLAKSDLIAGISYTQKDHKENARKGKSVYFLSFPNKPLADLPSPWIEYLRLGEAENLHTRYKCRIREPWYVVPYVWVSELSLLKRCHLYPRIVVNELGAYSTDTAYRIKLKPEYVGSATDLSFCFMNSLSFLFAEMLGRHYGGGVLELVPSEIERIPIPLIKIHKDNFVRLDAMIRQAASLDNILTFTDKAVLKESLQLSDPEITAIRKAHKHLLNRRLRTE